MKIIAILCFIIHLSNGIHVKQDNESLPDFIERMLESGYNAKVKPNYDESVTTVTINIYIAGISAINEINMEYGINIYMRQIWTDPRFEYTGYNKSLTLSYKHFDRIWVPDGYFRNEKDGKFHEITVPNRFISISPSGRVLYSQRLSMIMSCNMYLGKFPLDSQTCNMELESYGHSTDDIVYKWGGAGGGIENGTLELAEFTFMGTKLEDCTETYSIGTYTCVRAVLFLERKFQYYIVQVYIPSVMIVFLSWVSFWIDINSVPARISLGLLTVLTITTQASGISSRLPRVSYVKAIDIWMSTCLFFVFAALIEYALVNVLVRKPKKKKGGDVDDDDDYEDDDDDVNTNTQNNGITHKQGVAVVVHGDNVRQRRASTTRRLSQVKKKPSRLSAYWKKIHHNPAMIVEIISRGLFPLAFAVFNIIYWLSVLNS